MQGGRQGVLQSFPGHLQDVIDACFARSRLKIEAGPSVEIENVALAVHECAGGRDLLQQRLFRQLAQG